MREESTARKNSSKGHGRWKNFFKNISFAQIAASGLSAVTVFFLTSKIGLAGSIIGAVLASIISTISSQLYKNVIDESSRRIKGKRGDEDEGEEDEGGEGGEGGRSPRKGGRKPAKYLKQAEAYANFPRSFPPRGASRGAPPSKPARRTVSGSSAVVPQRSNAPVRTFRKERRKTKKKVVAVSIISSLITLAIVCGVILFVTDGKGTDVFLREAISKSKSIKDEAQDLASQAEKEKPSPASSAPSAPSASASSPSSATSSEASANPAAPSPSSSGAAKVEAQKTPNPASAPLQNSGKKEGEAASPSPSSHASGSSSRQEPKESKAKEKKAGSNLTAAPDPSKPETDNQDAPKN